MNKIIFCDLNNGLVQKVDELFKKHKQNKRDCKLLTHSGDIFEYQKQNGGLIATASNPMFTYGGGLDAQIKKNFPNEVIKNREFERTDNLFKTITVDKNITATKEIVKRALIGCFAYRNKRIIISGFGTTIGGLSEVIFLEALEEVLYANLRSANLSYANLSYANLRSADLRYANLISANLRSANLSYANLRSADLRSADLSSANLSFVDLSSANLSFVDLSSANLSSAALSFVDLSSAALSFVDLSSADLRSADLRSADLSSAKISYADLRSANLSFVKNLDTVIYNEGTGFFALQCPEEGGFIAYKKCINDTIVKLFIPEDAKRSSATTRKCRASKAEVLAIFNSEGKEIKGTSSSYDNKFKYIVGETVEPTNGFDEDRWNECGAGIHFFITKREAELYD